MPKSNAATVIDLDAFRQRKQHERSGRSERSESLVAQATVEPMMPMTSFAAQPMFVPVWVCWVPAWGPIVG